MAHLVSRTVHVALASLIFSAAIAACGTSADSTFKEGILETDDSGPPPPSGFKQNTDDGGAPVTNTLCKPRTCADQNIECGPAGDGCGGIIQDCGKCAPGLRCGGPNAL